MDREYLAMMHPEVVLLEPAELDAAILGLVDDDDTPRLIYSRRKLIECFEEQGMTWGEAVEWYDYNVKGMYAGPTTPMYLELEWGD